MVNFSYDMAGNMLKIKSIEGEDVKSIEGKYNISNQLIEVTNQRDETTKIAYDILGGIKEIMNFKNEKLEFEYNFSQYSISAKINGKEVQFNRKTISNFLNGNLRMTPNMDLSFFSEDTFMDISGGGGQIPTPPTNQSPSQPFGPAPTPLQSNRPPTDTLSIPRPFGELPPPPLAPSINDVNNAWNYILEVWNMYGYITNAVNEAFIDSLLLEIEFGSGLAAGFNKLFINPEAGVTVFNVGTLTSEGWSWEGWRTEAGGGLRGSGILNEIGAVIAWQNKDGVNTGHFGFVFPNDIDLDLIGSSLSNFHIFDEIVLSIGFRAYFGPGFGGRVGFDFSQFFREIVNLSKGLRCE